MNKNKWFLNGGRGSGKTFRLLCEAYENKIAELEKENAELKEINTHTLSQLNLDNGELIIELTKATELLKEFVQHYKAKTIYVENMQDLLKQSEQFLNSEGK